MALRAERPMEGKPRRQLLLFASSDHDREPSIAAAVQHHGRASPIAAENQEGMEE